MKNLFFMVSLFALTVGSCTSDDSPNYHYAVLAVESFDVPTSVETGGVYPITVRYKRPSTCHFFDGFYYDRRDHLRVIGVRNVVVDRNDCSPTDPQEPELERHFSFSPLETAPYTYVFKFYKGKDAQGENLFEEVQIPVE